MSERHDHDPLEPLLARLARQDGAGPPPRVTTAAVLRQVRRHHAPRREARLPRWIALPSPRVLGAGFAMLLVATPLAIAGWPMGASGPDTAVLALAMGDPFGDAGLNSLLNFAGISR
ncbi:hypothetical protein KM176_01655 [Pseudooceanicola sp. CBS1P-1]|uniref:Uncharacterized protein n=1 Tax=Pseudooceanicola albus TaxID=2692189 RepID=A0A6L7G3B6_9RHOB|nr:MULTISPECIES: hypothetical protein [Pseudooceanicola]MBT9382552.1 hypothetical protein [Pseudooceanicola endophyticus]MXN17093.1 hypothetical protein [Pseudooceanicola albus]